MTLRASIVLLLVGILAPSLGGCGIVYHRAAHHHTEMLGSAPVTDRKLVSTQPEGRELRGDLRTEELEVSALVRERQTWEIREGRATTSADVCDGRTWDHYFFWLTIGMPFLMAEYLTIIPMVVENVHDAQHARPSRTVEVRKVFEESSRRIDESKEFPVSRVDVVATVRVGAETLSLDPGRTGVSSPARIPIFGKWPKPLPDAPARLTLEATLDGKPWATSWSSPRDQAAFIAALQGARWDPDDGPEPASVDVRATARLDRERSVVVVSVRLSCGEGNPLYRSGVRAPDGKIFYWGRVDPGREVRARFELPYEDQGGVRLDFVEAADRIPSLEIDLQEDR